MVYNIGLECGAVFGGRACNAYLVTGDKNIIIDTVPKRFENEFVKAIENHISVSEIDGLFLLGVVPSRVGALEGVLQRNPEITVYATAAGLRNLSEITDLNFNGRVCKNGVEISFGKDVFVSYITPNLTSPDTMMLHDKYENSLYTGELFSSADDSSYFESNLRPFLTYIKPALETVSMINPSKVYPLSGCCESVSKASELYRDIICKEKDCDFVVVVYSSSTGNNKAMAHFAADELAKSGIETKIFCLDSEINSASAARELNRGAGLVICLPTENKTMPKPVWDFLSHIEVNHVSGKPYIVFSSYGWSCEGACMANEILSMLKMRRIYKFTQSIFTPKDEDKKNFKSSIDAFVDFISKQKEKSGNA